MVKLMLRIPNTDHDAYLEGLIYDGARRIRSSELFEYEQCTVKVENNSFTLPNEAKEIIAFRVNCVQGIFIDVPFFRSCGCTDSWLQNYYSWRQAVKKNGNTYYFITTQEDGAEVEVVYKKFILNEEGLIDINEEWQQALRYYAAYEFAVSYPETYTPNQVAVWNRNYQTQAAYCRGAAARRQFEQQREQISSRMNSILTINYSWWNNLFNSFYFRQSP